MVIIKNENMYAFKLSTRLAYLNAKLGTYEGETNLNETKKQFKEQLKKILYKSSYYRR